MKMNLDSVMSMTERQGGSGGWCWEMVQVGWASEGLELDVRKGKGKRVVRRSAWSSAWQDGDSGYVLLRKLWKPQTLNLLCV